MADAFLDGARDQRQYQVCVELGYGIARCSDHSGHYVAEHIMVYNPNEQASRWSCPGQTATAKQWVLLRLDKLSVVNSITFGKFFKQHPCNMKEFKVFVGLTEETLFEVLHAGLKNDAVSETFAIKHFDPSGVCFPVRFVKIVPLSAHGQSFHTSIWYVKLTGTAEESLVQNLNQKYDEHRETKAMRHVLKFLRQRRLLVPFDNILALAGFSLEHPLVSQLYDALVTRGAFAAAEQTVRAAASAGLFAAYLRALQPRALWRRLHGTDADGDVPRRRGGHAMCVDDAAGLVYVHGGWDGAASLDDLWVYSIADDRWRMLCAATGGERHGPGPRSCHKMVFDRKTGMIYVLGRLSDGDSQRVEHASEADAFEAPEHAGTGLLDTMNDSYPLDDIASPPTSSCEFYRYHSRGIDTGKWDVLSSEGQGFPGPPIVFDHQMVIDSEAQMIYVSGGRVVDGDWDITKYAGLFGYNIRTDQWTLLHPISPRSGHSMVFEPRLRQLLIFGGQLDGKRLSDMLLYDVATNGASELPTNFTAAGGPECLTQRAVIDPELHDIYVFCGLTSDGAQGAVAGAGADEGERPPNVMLETESPTWVYRYGEQLGQGRWTRIVSGAELGGESHVEEVPQARFAHQVVYHLPTKTLLMHGGNAGLAAGKEGEEAAERRLDDLWAMTLRQSPPDELVRKGTFYIRKQQFREMCSNASPVQALQFLQTQVSAVVNHEDPEETADFRSLLSVLLAPSQSASPPPAARISRKRLRSGDPFPSPSLGEPAPALDDDAASGHTPSKSVDGGEAPPVLASMGKAADGTFRERMQVFEALLAFVSPEAKEPATDLLDLMFRGETQPE